MNDDFAGDWYKKRFHAMGSQIVAWLETNDPVTAAAALAQAEELFEENEQALSRFRSDSELAKLNACSGQWVTVSDLLWHTLTAALEMATATNGSFDPTMLNALEHYGYSVSFEQLAPAINLTRPLSAPLHPGQWTAVALDKTRQAVLLSPGVRIDLGGIAKGYTAQQAVDLLSDLGPCLVDAGGDLAAGPAPRGLPGWPVAISSPLTDDGAKPGDLCTLWLSGEALATSGIDYRNWQTDEGTAHHLINPASGTPAITDGLTASVLAEGAAEAEAWATAVMVAGSGSGMDMLFEANLAGLMIMQSGGVIMTPSMHRRTQLLPAQFAAG